MFVQGKAPLTEQGSSGLIPKVTSSIQHSINDNLGRDRKYMESPFSVSMLPDGTYALWINRQVTHALPVAIAWLANNDKDQLFVFTVSSFPLSSPLPTPSTPEDSPKYFAPGILHVFITFLVAVSLSTVPCLSIRAIVSDRAVQTKHVLAGDPPFQRPRAVRTESNQSAVMGLPSSVYWLANWLFDAAGMTLFAIFGIIIYRCTIYTAPLNALFEVFSAWIMMTCLVTPLLAYMVSRWFSSHSKAQVINCIEHR